MPLLLSSFYYQLTESRLHTVATLKSILRRFKSRVFDYRFDLFMLVDRMVSLDRNGEKRFCKYVYSVCLLSGFKPFAKDSKFMPRCTTTPLFIIEFENVCN